MAAKSPPSDTSAGTGAPFSMRHVCICVDGSPVSSWTLPHGLAMARAFGASLTVLRVLELPDGGSYASSTAVLDWDRRRSMARDDLDRISKGYGSSGLPVDTQLLQGRVTEQICRWVSEHDVDLTVVCSHGTSGWTERGLASTARRLVNELPSPTLLVPASVLQQLPEKEIAYERIAVPLDASPQAEKALLLAIGLARKYDSELVLTHVVPVPELIKPEPLNEEELELERRVVERNTRVAERYLARRADDLSRQGVRVRTVLAQDDVRLDLMRTIEDMRPNLVVLSGHGRRGRAPLRLGSVASFLLEHALAPTLIVRGAFG